MKSIILIVLLLGSILCRGQSLERVTISNGICNTHLMNCSIGKTLIFKFSDTEYQIKKNKINSDFTKELNLNSQKPDNKIEVYPNPATKDIWFKTAKEEENISISIFSISGKFIKTYKPNSNNINIEQLASGGYFLVVKNNENQILGTAKFLKK